MKYAFIGMTVAMILQAVRAEMWRARAHEVRAVYWEMLQKQNSK